jgi:succinate-acetate transporter protein
MNKIIFLIGISMIVIAAVLLLSNFMGDSTFPAFLGFLGIVMICASNYRPMKQKKE